MTPFGLPLVPLVYTIVAISSELMASYIEYCPASKVVTVVAVSTFRKLEGYLGFISHNNQTKLLSIIHIYDIFQSNWMPSMMQYP